MRKAPPPFEPQLLHTNSLHLRIHVIAAKQGIVAHVAKLIWKGPFTTSVVIVENDSKEAKQHSLSVIKSSLGKGGWPEGDRHKKSRHNLS